MDLLGGRTVIEYQYDNESEAIAHETLMINDNWIVEMKKYRSHDHYRMYSKHFSGEVGTIN